MKEETGYLYQEYEPTPDNPCEIKFKSLEEESVCEMKDEDKKFIENYEKLLNEGYCNCNEMNCIDNNSPRRILNIVKQLEFNWKELKNWAEQQKEIGIAQEHPVTVSIANVFLDKMQELESGNND